jgi:hypothetical protein
LFGNDADTGPSRSRQSLTDSFLECGGDWGTPQDLVGFLSELHALKIDLFGSVQSLSHFWFGLSGTRGWLKR